MKLFDFLNKVDNAKEAVKKGVNKKERSEDEKEDIKKANKISTLFLILSIGVGVGLYFVFPVFTNFDFASGFWIAAAIIVALGFFYKYAIKHLNFVKDDVVGYGAKLYAYIVVALAFLALFINLGILFFSITA